MSEQLKFQLYENELLEPLNGHTLTLDERLVAEMLLRASAGQPLTLREIRDAHQRQRQTKRALTEREAKSIIRTLRRDHCFPIISRRGTPPGLWWCTSVEDMEAFVQTFRAQALDELQTLSKIVRKTYPMLAGQLVFDSSFD